MFYDQCNNAIGSFLKYKFYFMQFPSVDFITYFTLDDTLLEQTKRLFYLKYGFERLLAVDKCIC
jgi:hypothetical protein